MGGFLEDLAENGEEGVIKMIIGNKSDLDDKREITTEEAMEFAKNNEIAYIETSAKSGNNVNVAFEKLIEGNKKKNLFF